MRGHLKPNRVIRLNYISPCNRPARMRKRLFVDRWAHHPNFIVAHVNQQVAAGIES